MLTHPYLGPILARLRPALLPDVDYLCEDRGGPVAIPLRPDVALPTQAEVDLEASIYLADLEAKRLLKNQKAIDTEARRAALTAFMDGSGDLTARQLTVILRVLVREVLGDA